MWLEETPFFVLNVGHVVALEQKVHSQLSMELRAEMKLLLDILKSSGSFNV